MDRISVARLTVAALIVVAIAGAIARPERRNLFVPAIAVTIAGFIALVRWSRRLDDRRRRALSRAAVGEQGAYRAERSWSSIDPQPWTWPSDEGEHQRIDLDITGTESLVQLLPTISAAVGAPRLREWFATLANEDVVLARQTSVRELIGATELREAFEMAARQLRVTQARIDEFIAWGRVPGQTEPRWLAIASRAFPALSIGCIVAAAGWPPAGSLALLSIFTTLVLATTVRSRTRNAVRAAEIGTQIAGAYVELTHLVCTARFDAPLLRELQSAFGRDVTRADTALERLQRLANWAEVRSSPMLHAALQALFAWDCQIARSVERWRADHGTSLRAWFDALAELECLAALAGFAYTNPNWSFPELTPDTPLHVRGRALGHPLLPDGERVANDVEIGPAGTVLLISGSNMSGKSTLLRAIGLNALLARLGGPVCAEAMWCPPLRLFTSLRVQDSLADHTSYFMAEALRLRDIIFAAEDTSANAPPVLYLIDEILRGTNSEERAVAARFIVARLLKTSAIGVVTTHDLGIFTVPEIAAHARHGHFAERFVGAGDAERLTFDYRLQPGPATSSNALRLLSLIGLVDV
jgi:hypothetical protein